MRLRLRYWNFQKCRAWTMPTLCRRWRGNTIIPLAAKNAATKDKASPGHWGTESDAMPPRNRETAALAAELLDVLVIGGGIVGAGVARDAAMRGLRTGLVEKQDFACGTSSRSSRLLHGGLRYLAQGR